MSFLAEGMHTSRKHAFNFALYQEQNRKGRERRRGGGGGVLPFAPASPLLALFVAFQFTHVLTGGYAHRLLP